MSDSGDVRAHCPFCGGNLRDALSLWVDFVDSSASANGVATPNGRQHVARKRTRTPAGKPARHPPNGPSAPRSAYHEHLSRGLLAHKPLRVIQQEWRALKAGANGAAPPGPAPDVDRDQFLAWATQSKAEGGGGLAPHEAMRRWRERDKEPAH